MHGNQGAIGHGADPLLRIGTADIGHTVIDPDPHGVTDACCHCQPGARSRWNGSTLPAAVASGACRLTVSEPARRSKSA